MEFGPADDYSSRPAFLDPQVQIGILLVLGALPPIPFGIGHGPVDQQVLLLDPFPVVPEPLVIGSPMFPVALKGGAEDGVGRVQSRRSVENSRQSGRRNSAAC